MNATEENWKKLWRTLLTAKGGKTGQTWSRLELERGHTFLTFWLLRVSQQEFAANVDKKATGSRHWFVFVWPMSADDPLDNRTRG